MDNSGSLGSLGELAPGQTISAQIGFTAGGVGQITFQLESPDAQAELSTNLASQEDTLRPTYTAPDPGMRSTATSSPSSAATSSATRKSLDQASNYLSLLGETVTDPATLTAFEFGLADDTLPRPILTSATDASSTEPGSLSLTFTRNYLQPIDGRYAVGPLGRGWDDPWDLSVSVDSNGVVDISTPGTNRFFYPQAGGGYAGAPGDHATLTEQYGAFQLEETDGTITAFRTDGLLDYIQDANGNRISAVYTGSLLTSLVDSNGDTMSFNYDAMGRITQMIDPEGRVTTYHYDPTDQYLLSVTGPQGTTSYQYSTPTSGPAAYELLSITYPGGTHHYFTYDSLGRLTGESLDGGADAYLQLHLTRRSSGDRRHRRHDLLPLQ